jgi:hypothetical protein
MTLSSLEKRVQSLETEVADLKLQLANSSTRQEPWWKKIDGIFSGDPAFLEAMELGRKWRESGRPKQSSSKRKKRKHADT